MRIASTFILWERDPKHVQTERMIASCEKIGTTDFVIGVDKKSAPGTTDWLQKRLPKAKVFEFTWRDDFSWARNLTLRHIPAKVDWWFWIDSDDEIQTEEDVPAYLASLPGEIGAVMCPYDYGRDEHGNRTTTHDRLRFMRWKSDTLWKWRNRCHEDVKSEPMQRWHRNVDIVWFHHTDERAGADAIGRNLRILKLAIQEDPKDVRSWYYLGNAYFSNREWAEAAKCYEQYVGMSGWDDEKWAALIYCAIAYRELNLVKAALNADLRAMELKPEYPDSYLGLAYTHSLSQDWPRAKYWAELSVERIHKQTLPPPYLFVNPRVYAYDPYQLLAVVYFNLGDNEGSIRAYNAAIEAVPDPKLIKERDHLKAGMRRLESVEKGLQLAAHLIGVNEPIKARQVLDNLPSGSDEQFVEVNKARATIASRIAENELQARQARMAVPREPVDPRKPLTLEENPVAYWLGRHLAGCKRVLLIGVPIPTAIHVARQGVDVVGTDIDPSRVQEANRVAQRLGLQRTTKIDGVGKVPMITVKSPVQFHWCPPDDLDYKLKLTDGSSHAVRDLGPFDAVVIADLQTYPEHEKVLAQAESVSNRVILMVPDGSFDGPQQPDGISLRQWSRMELGRFLFPKGLITDLHNIHSEKGDRGTLVAQYLAGGKMETEGVQNAIIRCFNTGQGWSPDNLWRGGIGGSETAAIHMARQLTGAGYRVTVFAECEGVWDGVLYRKVEQFRPFPCKLYIEWRSLGVLTQMAEFADHRFLWMHDTDVGQIANHQEKLKGVTIVALSDWQIGHLNEVYPGTRVKKSGNGIVPERFDKKVKREPYRLIWASSPDRGLEPILQKWPEIKAEFPKATLHVFYGFDLARRARPQFMAKLDKQLAQPGITVHGRVDQDTLAVEYQRSDVLVYQSVLPEGSLFHETYCIMAVEAQAAGCVPITHSHGALAETNHCGIQTDDVWAALRAFWKMPKDQRERMRQNGMEWARQQTWEKVRDGWLQIIEEDDARVREQGSPLALEAGEEGLGESTLSRNGSGGITRPPQFARGGNPES